MLIGACATTFTSPTPAPALSGDSDGDGISDGTEGSGDEDNDDRPNYLDKDSDGDTISDLVEGTTDTDGDGVSDYLDGDSDGDGVGDEIERKPGRDDNPESGKDDDRDGIDDGSGSRTTEPVTDSDGDGAPDYRDTDSDNDGKSDGDEAFDLDGDGDRDIEPLGRDIDLNGIDDGLEEVQDPDELNLSYVGLSNGAPCTSVSSTAAKELVVTRMAALADRVPLFASRTRSCGGANPRSLVSAASSKRRSFVKALHQAFPDSVLSCPVDVCPAVKTKKEKAALNALATDLFGYAKRSKLGAMRVCPSAPESGQPDNRPGTDAYLTQLRSAISKLPSAKSSCE